MAKYLLLLPFLLSLSCLIFIPGGERIYEITDPEIELYYKKICMIVQADWDIKKENTYISITSKTPQTYFSERKRSFEKLVFSVIFKEKQSYETYSERRNIHDKLIEKQKVIFKIIYPDFEPFKDPYKSLKLDGKNDSLITVYNQIAKDLWINKNTDYYPYYTESYTVDLIFPEEYEAVFKDTNFKIKYYEMIDKVKKLFFSYEEEYLKSNQI